MKPGLTTAATDAGRGPAGDRIDPRVWRVAAVVAIGPFMTQLDSTVVNVSLSAISQDLHASTAAAQWIISGYLLALALMLPLSGWLVDRVGAKRLYLGCFSVFTLASLLCGAARTMDELILARLLQGMAGGLLAPMTQMMMARAAGRHMARVMGYTVMPILIAPILGPIVAGAILTHAAWPWLFYLNLPMGVLGLGLAALLLPGDAATIQKRPFDLSGFLLISPGLACFLYGLPNASHLGGASVLAAGVLLLGTFAWHALRQGNAALIDLQLFDNRTFSAAAATQFLSNGVFNGRQLLIPLFLITGCALTAAQAGGLVTAMGVGMLCSYPLVGSLTDRFGCRTVSAGGALLALAGMIPFIWMTLAGFSLDLTMASLFAVGVGHGTINIPSVSAAYASVPKERLAVANTAINIVQRLGGPLATTITTFVMSLTMAHGPAPGPRPFLVAFVFLAGLQLITFGAATQLPKSVQPDPQRA